MSSICEHMFEDPDPYKPDYSLTEFDLAARLNLSIRKNLKTNMYEIFNIASNKVYKSFDNLDAVIREANYLENSYEIEIEHDINCERG